MKKNKFHKEEKHSIRKRRMRVLARQIARMQFNGYSFQPENGAIVFIPGKQEEKEYVNAILSRNREFHASEFKEMIIEFRRIYKMQEQSRLEEK